MAKKPKSIEKIDTTTKIDPNSGDTYVKVSIYYSTGEVDCKTMGFKEYSMWLLGAKEEQVPFVHLDMESLPKYYYDGMISSEKDTFKVMLLVPAGKHQLVSENYDFAETIPYPALLFKLSVNKGVCVHKDCYAVIPEKDGKLKDDSRLYRYPYGNVSSDGGICMGNISVKLADISESDKFCEEFFLGIDEGHYYEPGEMVSKDWNLGKLYNEVLKKDSFPKTWLVPNGMTYKDVKFK